MLTSDSKAASVTQRKRYSELSLLSVIFCILVVFIHCSSEPVTNLDKNSWQYIAVFLPWRLSSFVVQGFIMLSGIKLFLGNTDSVGYIKYVAKRLKTVFLPYVLWVLVCYFWFLYHHYFEFSFGDIFGYIFKGNLVGHFYFVVVIMQFYLLYPLWKLMLRKLPCSAAVCLSLGVMILLSQGLVSLISVFFPGYFFPYNDRIFTTYLFYFVCGCFIGANYDVFKATVLRFRYAITVLFAIFAFLDGFVSLGVFRGVFVFAQLDILHTLYIISAVFFFIMVANVLCGKREKLPAVLSHIDSASYIIYLSHPLFIFFIDGYFLYKINSIAEKYFIRLICTYVVVFTVCITYKIIKRGILNYVKSRRKLKVQ